MKQTEQKTKIFFLLVNYVAIGKKEMKTENQKHISE